MLLSILQIFPLLSIVYADTAQYQNIAFITTDAPTDIVYNYQCYWDTPSYKTIRGTSSNCGPLCLLDSSCTHFDFDPPSGSCFFKWPISFNINCNCNSCNRRYSCING